MGRDSFVHLMYGIRFPDADSNTGVFNDNSYNRLVIGDNVFITCFCHTRDVSRGNSCIECEEVTMPSEELKAEFLQWCLNNSIDQQPKFHSVIEECY